MRTASPSKAEFRDLVHTTAKMLAGCHFDLTRPAQVSAREYVAACWPEFVSKAVDFLALQAALLERDNAGMKLGFE